VIVAGLAVTVVLAVWAGVWPSAKFVRAISTNAVAGNPNNWRNGFSLSAKLARTAFGTDCWRCAVQIGGWIVRRSSVQIQGDL
jgi:hypothetical protein